MMRNGPIPHHPSSAGRPVVSADNPVDRFDQNIELLIGRRLRFTKFFDRPASSVFPVPWALLFADQARNNTPNFFFPSAKRFPDRIYLWTVPFTSSGLQG